MSRESAVKRPKYESKSEPKEAKAAVKVEPQALPAVSTSAPLTSDALLKMPAADYMNASQMGFFRARLMEMKRQLIENAGETSEHLRDNDVVPDPADRATIEEEHALELRTRDRERKLMKKIDQALARIDDGSYGYCEETGDAIGLPRLLARPTATMSVEAQQRRELKQKLFGE
ncbi:MAG: RNA polymerase-binding protein DksA [Betaproteobacteria bacterium]|nr:RNA polymerase-binding protein DksA [Betaproteobacteria bacterium]